MFTVIISKKYIASLNINKALEKLELPSNLKISVLNIDTVYAENIDKELEGDFFIFATLHKSNTPKKTLTVHAPGNWNQADFGGQQGKICKTSAFFLKHIFQTLNKINKQKNSEYECTLECTHHGPFLEKPCCFIEIGSTKEQWQDKKPAEIIAKSIIKAVKNFDSNAQWKPAIGIGGPHYAPNFSKIQLNSSYALSHIIPQYSLPLNENMIKQALEKTIEKNPEILLDWKGLGKSEDRKQVTNVLDKLGLNYKRTSEIEK